MKRDVKQSKKVILVLGGRGFIGRHVVDTLRNRGHRVVVGSRYAGQDGETLKVPFHLQANQAAIVKQLSRFDVVINAVGILRERWGETYDLIHHRFVEQLANACAKHHIRFIHVSVLGLHNTFQSRFLTSKRLGETAIKKAGGDFIVVRPSLIDGQGGYGAKWFRRVAKWPFHFLPSNARGVLAPIHVLDLAMAIAVLSENKDILGGDRIVELGGRDRLTTFEYLALLRGKPPVATFRIPAWIARLFAHVCDCLHLTPLSFGHYELLKFDNVPNINRLTDLIRTKPRELGVESVNGKLGWGGAYVA